MFYLLLNSHKNTKTQKHRDDRKYSLHFTFTNFDVDKLDSDCTAAQPCPASYVVWSGGRLEGRSLGRSVEQLLVRKLAAPLMLDL